MEQLKKSWETPQLIILARGTPDESVLSHCKIIDKVGPNTGPDTNAQTNCNKLETNKCGNCKARAGS